MLRNNSAMSTQYTSVMDGQTNRWWL